MSVRIVRKKRKVKKSPGERFRRWYARNKDKYNKRRKKRYRTDPEYRAKVIDGVRRRRAEEKERRDGGEA